MMFNQPQHDGGTLDYDHMVDVIGSLIQSYHYVYGLDEARAMLEAYKDKHIMVLELMIECRNESEGQA